MKILVAGLLVLLGVTQALADGLPIVNGRYPGSVMVFRLSARQHKAIEHFVACHLENFQSMNVYTPYVFQLEKSQRMRLKKRLGFAPAYFEVYQTYKGFNDAGPHWNLALQFSKDHIEIPLDLVVTDRESKDAQNEQGWKQSNPCFSGVK